MSVSPTQPGETGTCGHILFNLIKCKKGGILFLNKPNKLIMECWLFSGSGYGLHSARIYTFSYI